MLNWTSVSKANTACVCALKRLCVIQDKVPDLSGSCLCADSLYDPDQGAGVGGPQTACTRFAATLEDGIADFDAASFRVAPSEAAVMDPHTRLLLEHTAETLADAHKLRPKMQGSRPSDVVQSTTIGVFVGCMWSGGTQLVLGSDLHYAAAESCPAVCRFSISPPPPPPGSPAFAVLIPQA